MIITTAVRWQCDWREAMGLEMSATCRDRVQFFGCPYAIKHIAYGAEVRRVGISCGPIGCLNQQSDLPLLAWYPEGDWVNKEEVVDG